MSAKLIQKTWWGEEFVSALEAYIDPGRLQRGKAYRTDKRVLDFKINGSEIQATLRGNINPYFGVTKEPRYKVRLKFDQISQKKWQTIIKNICGNALWLSKLMLNEIPGNIEEAFAGDSFLPSSYRYVKTSCTCPDSSDPCKHIAGIYYRIAAILDADPMLLFQLRGLMPEKLHQELRKTELGQAFSEHFTLPADVDMEYQQHKYTPIHSKRKKAAPIAQQAAKQSVNTSQFWSMPVCSMPAPAHLVNESLPESTDNSTFQESVSLGAQAGSIAWPNHHLSSDKVSDISAALIKKQGDYPEFWTKNNSFINAMELFYSHTRKKNSKDLL